MKQIIQIDGNNVFIGTETNEIINITLECVNYENPQVGDAVEIYENGDTVLVMKADEIDDKTKSPNTTITTNSKKKKKWIIIGIVLAILFLFIGFVSCSGNETYDWPDSEMANMLPEPDGKITAISESDNDYLSATVKIDDGYCKTYIDACIEKGFNVDKDLSNYDGSYDYTAKNESGWEINIDNFDKNEMQIHLYSPEWLTDDEDDTDDSSSEESTNDETESGSDKLVNGMRAEFKEAMDSYEEFYDEYCDFMEEYADDPTDLNLISQYSDLVSKAADMDKKFEKWDEDDLNDAELQYYLEVSERISKKLLEIAEYIQ